jgi:hypothetical protein
MLDIKNDVKYYKKLYKFLIILWAMLLLTGIISPIYSQSANKCLDFDGVNDFVVIPDKSSLQLSSGISIEAWIYFSSAFSSHSSNNDLGLVNKGNYSLGLDFQSGKLVFELDDTSATSWTKSYEGSNEIIKSLIVYNGKLYAGQGNGSGDGDIFVYDGSTWSTSYDGSQENIESFEVYNGKLYAGQSKTTGYGDVLVFDGSTWDTSYYGSQEAIKSLAVYNGKLYAGQGNGPGDGDIFVYDGSTWDTTYNGAQKRITALAVYNGKLYAGQGNVSGTGDILVFDGSTWSTSYNGAQEVIKALCVFSGKLYAGQGSSTGDGDILVFNDTTWSVSYDGAQETIESLEVYNGKLYAGQGTGTGDGDILVLDDTTWNTSYNGNQEQILDLAEFDGKLYAGQGKDTLDGDVYVYGNSVVLESNKSSWSADSWYHIAATFDGSNMKIFVNGKEDASLTTSITIDTDSIPLWIGYDGSNSYFDAAIDEVRIWNIARDLTSIRDKMCCKLLGNETGLVGYWRIDEGSGTDILDETVNNNNGSLTNMASDDWGWSGAPVGDSSIYDYTGSIPSDFSVTLSNVDGDEFTATGNGGSFDGIHLLRTDETTLRTDATIPTNWNIDTLRFWSVFASGTNSTFSITYNYSGHPGITDESDLALAYRVNNSDDSWEDLAATLDEVANTLSKSSQSNSEYALGSKTGVNSLPIELVSFAAELGNNNVILTWETATEVNNYGFEVQRSMSNVQSQSWQLLGFIDGHGNSNSPKIYSFIDENVVARKYSYRLKQIDTDGQFEYSKIIEIDLGTVLNYELSQNYPNPFNPSTTIRFSVSESSLTNLSVYNSLGEKIEELVNEVKEPGIYTILFNAESTTGKLSSGTYFYRLQANDFTQIKKMILIK